MWLSDRAVAYPGLGFDPQYFLSARVLCMKEGVPPPFNDTALSYIELYVIVAHQVFCFKSRVSLSRLG